MRASSPLLLWPHSQWNLSEVGRDQTAGKPPVRGIVPQRYSVSRAWGVMPSEIFRFPFRQRSSSIMAFSSPGSRMRSW